MKSMIKPAYALLLSEQVMAGGARTWAHLLTFIGLSAPLTAHHYG